jgi:ADP-ribose pyrophosphatase YjhB (NUDIX family)
MFKVYCTGIVHYPDGVVLVRDNDKQRWRLPERVVDETEDVLLCMRRTVLTQTGYRAVKLRLYKVQTQPRTSKLAPFIRFIFGCEIGTQPIQNPEALAACFTPNDIIRIAAKDEFNDRTLLNLVHNYHAGIAPAPNNGPLSG